MWLLEGATDGAPGRRGVVDSVPFPAFSKLKKARAAAAAAAADAEASIAGRSLSPRHYEPVAAQQGGCAAPQLTPELQSS